MFLQANPHLTAAQAGQILNASQGVNAEAVIQNANLSFASLLTTRVTSALTSSLSDTANGQGVFNQLQADLNHPLSELGAPIQNILERTGNQILGDLSSVTMNFCVLFDFNITHQSGKRGPGVVVDGTCLLAIFNEIEKHNASGNLPGLSLPDDGASGGGVVVQGYMPSVFLFNTIIFKYKII